MNNKFLSVINVTILLSLLGVSIPKAFAEPKSISFDIETNLDATTGIGLLMTPAGLIQKSDIEIVKAEHAPIRATMKYDSSEVTPDTLASIVLFSSEGEVAVSSVRGVSSVTSAMLPKCPESKAISATAENQVGLLESLVNVRTARRDNAQARVAEMMKGDFLETLRKLEKGFGLTNTKDLSPTLTPLELVDRLSRILNAVKNYRIGKPTSTPQK